MQRLQTLMEEGFWDEKDGEDVFTYKGVDYVFDEEHGGTLLISQKCIDDNKLEIEKRKLIKLSEDPEHYKDDIEDGYDYLLSISHLCAVDDDGDDDDEEATLAVNCLPSNLLELDGCAVRNWRG